MSIVPAFAVTASRAPRGNGDVPTAGTTTTTSIRTTGTTTGGAGCGGETD